MPDYSQEYWSLQREDLSEDIGKNTNVEAQFVTSGQSLQDYLKAALNNDMLVLRALSSLQLLGYSETTLPEGYQVEIRAGKLSLFSQAEDGSRQYYTSSETGKQIHDLPLLAAIPHQEVLYFKSGGYREALPLKKSKNKAEARQMVEDALEQGRFAKLTGMVNGVKISDKVRLGMRHKIAAQEMLFLLNNIPSVFDAETLAWINRSGNLEDLKALSEENWREMNQPKTEPFQKARSAKGVIQLTLAWRRLRSILPTDLVNEIRKNSLKLDKISSVQMTLAQTEFISGKELAEDRKVMVETVILSKEPSLLSNKTGKLKTPVPVLDAQSAPEKESKEDESNKEATATGNERQAKEIEINQIPEGSTEAPKSPEKIAQEAWQADMMMFQDLLEPYPEISMTVSEGNNTTKLVELSYVSDLKQKGEFVTVNQVAEVTLPTASDGYPLYKKEDRELLNPGEVITEMVDTIKAQIQESALAQFESLMQTHVLKALPAENIPQSLGRWKENRQERQELRAKGKSRGEVRDYFKERRQALNQRQGEFIEGNFDSVIDSIRQHYAPKSLKLDTLVGKQRYTDTTFFSGGSLGLAPLLISVERQKDQVGLVFSGAKIKKPIFYSLESNAKYEVESPSN